jgi:DNA-binding Lrp family transcriptional regulator
MSEIDDVDRRIVDLLIEDGRMPCAEIARRLGMVSERVVRYRLDRMVAAGLVHVGAIPNPKALGYGVTADVFIQVDAASILGRSQVPEYECIAMAARWGTDISTQSSRQRQGLPVTTELTANILRKISP